MLLLVRHHGTFQFVRKPRAGPCGRTLRAGWLDELDKAATVTLGRHLHSSSERQIAMARIRLVSDLSTMQALRPAWAELFDASRDAHPFLCWEWQFLAWLETRRNAALHIVVVERDRLPVALIPLRRSTFGAFGRLLEPLAFPMGDYCGGLALAGGEGDVARACEYLLEFSRRPGVLVRLARVRLDSQLGEVLERLRDADPRVRELARFPALQLDLPEDREIVAPKTRGIRNRFNKLNREMEVEFVFNEEDHAHGLGILRELHEKRWDEREQEFRGILSSESGVDFASNLLAACSRNGIPRLSVLYADSRPIAGVLGFVVGRSYYYYRPSFDPEYGSYSPGHVLLTYVLKAAARECRRVDFLRGDQGYKRVWASDTVEVASYGLTRPGPLGRVTSLAERVAAGVQRRLHRSRG